MNFIIIVGISSILNRNWKVSQFLLKPQLIETVFALLQQRNTNWNPMKWTMANLLLRNLRKEWRVCDYRYLKPILKDFVEWRTTADWTETKARGRVDDEAE